jgi:hypothetical protein
MGRTHSTRSRTAFAVTALAASLAVAGCTGEDDDASTDMSAQAASVDAGLATAPAGTLAPAAASDQAAAVETAGVDWGSLGRDVIVELHVQMETDDIARTVAAITADAVNAGGGVASSDVSYGTENAEGEPNHDGHAVLVVKVPPAEVARVLGNLDASGRVLSMNQSSQDVTDQLIDLDVRIANKRASVENVRTMMEQAADLNQLVALEAELTWRQTELEQLEAQQRSLSDRVALSTITIEVRPAPDAGPNAGPAADDDSIGDAFGKGWDAFATLLFGVAFVLAALAPFIVTAAVVGLLAWIVMRARRRPEPPRQPVPTDSADIADDELTPV